MSKIALLNIKGEKVKDIKLDEKIWNIEPNDAVIYDAIILANASLRQGTHSTKTRAEVRGGGRKPWRQKGTGNARQGSIRSPHWRHGGVALGPRPENNYTKKMNKKERRLAIQSALSYKVIKDKLVAIENLDIENGKTKTMLDLVSNLKLNKKTLFVTTDLSENLILASRNIKNIRILLPNEMSVLDIVGNENLVVTEDAIKVIEEVFI